MNKDVKTENDINAIKDIQFWTTTKFILGHERRRKSKKNGPGQLYVMLSKNMIPIYLDINFIFLLSL